MGSAAEIVHKGRSLGGIIKGVFGCKDVVVHQTGAVSYLDHKVSGIPIIDITANPCPLGLPVKPGSQQTVMDIIMMNLHIYCRM